MVIRGLGRLRPLYIFCQTQYWSQCIFLTSWIFVEHRKAKTLKKTFVFVDSIKINALVNLQINLIFIQYNLNKRTEKLQFTKINRSSKSCVKFKSAHCRYRDQWIRIISILHKGSQLGSHRMPLTTWSSTRALDSSSSMWTLRVDLCSGMDCRAWDRN